MSAIARLALAAAALCACAEVHFPTELTTFTAYPGNPVFAPAGGAAWDAELRERGFILREADRFHLWFTGSNDADGGRGRLGYASSHDGFTWTRHPQNPIYSESWIEDVMVVKHDGAYLMFAEGMYDQMQLLTSTDRMHWTRRGRVDIRYTSGRPLTPGPYGTPVVWHEDGLWYLFYERMDDGIWLATSPDLRTFTNVQDDPVLTIGPGLHDATRVAMSQIVKYQGRYYAYYNGQGPLGSWTTNIASSPDLRHWSKYAGNPLLPVQAGETSALLIEAPEGLRLYTMDSLVRVHLSTGRITPAPGPP